MVISSINGNYRTYKYTYVTWGAPTCRVLEGFGFRVLSLEFFKVSGSGFQAFPRVTSEVVEGIPTQHVSVPFKGWE